MDLYEESSVGENQRKSFLHGDTPALELPSGWSLPGCIFTVFQSAPKTKLFRRAFYVEIFIFLYLYKY